jgi:cytochrome c oxidase subunit 1
MNLHEVSAIRLGVGVATPGSARLLSSERVARAYLGTYVLLLLLGIIPILYAQTASTFPSLGLGAGMPVVRARQLHSAIMTYLCLIPGVPAALGAVLLPRLLGQKHFASNNYALASLIVYWVAAVVIVVSALGGGGASGILHSATYSSRGPVASIGVAVGVLLVGVSCSLNGIFAIKATAHWFFDGSRTRRLSPVVSTVCINGIMHLLLLPVQCLIVTLILQKHFGIRSLFDPSNGTDPMLLRQLSWFYLHPLMTVALFPAFGLVDYAIEGNVAKNRPERAPASAVLLHSTMIAAILGCLTSGLHLLQAGLSPWLSTVTSSLSVFLIVPFGLSFAHVHAKLCAVSGYARLCLRRYSASTPPCEERNSRLVSSTS